MATEENARNETELRKQVKSLECHYNWGIQQVRPQTALCSTIRAVDIYNKSKKPVEKFAVCLHAAFFVSCFGREETCEKLLLVANLILEHNQDPTSPAPPDKLHPNPFKEADIWDLPAEEFLAKCEELTGNEHDGKISSDSDSDVGYGILKNKQEPKEEREKGEEESASGDDDGDAVGTLKLWNEDRFTGMYTGAKHLLDALQALMLFENGVPNSDIEYLLTSITPVSQMSASDCAFIRYIEAMSWFLLGKARNFLKALGGTVLADPADIKWYLYVMEVLYSVRACRHLDWGRRVEWKDVETFLDVTDTILDLSPAPWMVVNLNFEKLQAINDYMVSFKKTMPYAENERLFDICFNLCKKVIENTTQTEFLAYCAQFLSRRPHTMDLAVSTIEAAVAAAVDHDRAYINAKACNIFLKVKRFEEALACAETAAEEAFGSNWQVLEVKTLLGHDINLTEFFKVVGEKCKLRTHVEQLHINAFLYYMCKTKDIVGAISHIKKSLKLATIMKSRDIMGDIFCKWIQDNVNMAEACNNVVLYVLNGDYNDDDIELTDETVELCQKLKDILEKDHLKGRELGRLRPKEYVRWLRSSKNRRRDQTAENSSWPHQKYTQDMYGRRRTSNHSGDFYGGNSASRGGSRCVPRGNSEYNGNSSGGGYSGNNVHDQPKPQALSWRSEMRPPSKDDAGPSIQAAPGSPSGRKQPPTSWRSRSPDPDQTNESQPHRAQQYRTSGSISGSNQPPQSWVSPWQSRSSDQNQTRYTPQRSLDNQQNPRENNNRSRSGQPHDVGPNWRNRSE